ncbi:MAG: hypothetical protein ACEPOZ_22235 [Marinifilaceae bacterium]
MKNANYKAEGRQESFLQSKMKPGLKILKSFHKDFGTAYGAEWSALSNGNFKVLFFEEGHQRMGFYCWTGELKEIWDNIDRYQLPEIARISIIETFGPDLFISSVWRKRAVEEAFLVEIDLSDRSRYKLDLNSKGKIVKSELIFVINSGENR